jgi:nucleoside-diphosphate-sugar epimerase
MKNILLTGSTGFVGRQILLRLVADDFQIQASLRNDNADLPGAVNCHQVGGLLPDTKWQAALTGVDCVIHAAARVHVMNDDAPNSLAAFREVNVTGTLNLAKQAAQEGVNRFIFISSIKVNGECTPQGVAFKPADQAEPMDSYGASKLEAENALMSIGAETGMEIVIIRPPLVYGSGVKGNFLSLLKLARTSLPLPLGAVNNKRSMVYVGNLVDLIVTCIEHPNAANQLFLASDCHDISTTQLLSCIRALMNKPKMLVPVPVFLFRLLGSFTGKRAIIDRLFGSLQVDSRNTRELLGWTPPYTVEQGLTDTVSGFLEIGKQGK